MIHHGSILPEKGMEKNPPEKRSMESLIFVELLDSEVFCYMDLADKVILECSQITPSPAIPVTSCGIPLVAHLNDLVTEKTSLAEMVVLQNFLAVTHQLDPWETLRTTPQHPIWS